MWQAIAGVGGGLVNATQIEVEHIYQGGRDLRLERPIQSPAENKDVGEGA